MSERETNPICPKCIKPLNNSLVGNIDYFCLNCKNHYDKELNCINNPISSKQKTNPFCPKCSKIVLQNAWYRYCSDCDWKEKKKRNKAIKTTGEVTSYFLVFCPVCKKQQPTVKHYDNMTLCTVCGYTGELIVKTCEQKTETQTFAETLSLLSELKDEFILLETIRQTVRDWLVMVEQNDYRLKPEFTPDDFIKKTNELRQLVLTD